MMWLNQRKLLSISLFLIAANFILICGGRARAAEKIAVFVSIPPQKYFLQQIGAQRVAKEIGGQVIFADPLASDWSGNLREVAASFKTALR